jgi:hypothetical protein
MYESTHYYTRWTSTSTACSHYTQHALQKPTKQTNYEHTRSTCTHAQHGLIRVLRGMRHCLASSVCVECVRVLVATRGCLSGMTRTCFVPREPSKPGSLK